jgi:hypothetical protein
VHVCVCRPVCFLSLWETVYRNKPDTAGHKVLTYIEYRAVSGVFRTIDPHPPSPSSECVLPPRAGGAHTGRAVRGLGGVNISEDARLGLASYSIISLRCRSSRIYSFLLPVMKYWFFSLVFCVIDNYSTCFISHPTLYFVFNNTSSVCMRLNGGEKL